MQQCVSVCFGSLARRSLQFFAAVMRAHCVGVICTAQQCTLLTYCGLWPHKGWHRPSSCATRRNGHFFPTCPGVRAAVRSTHFCSKQRSRTSGDSAAGTTFCHFCAAILRRVNANSNVQQQLRTPHSYYFSLTCKKRQPARVFASIYSLQQHH